MNDVHDSNPNLPRRPGKPVDEVAMLVLDLLVANGGTLDSEPGQLLKAIAEATDCDYFGVATAVRMLEDVGFIQVERAVAVRAEKANRVISIHLL